MDFAVCLSFYSLISQRKMEPFSFKMLYIYQELLKKEGIIVCQDLMV